MNMLAGEQVGDVLVNIPMGPEAIIAKEPEVIHNDMRDDSQTYDANQLVVPRQHHSAHVATLLQDVRSTPSIVDLVSDVSLRIEPVIVSDSGDEVEQSQSSSICLMEKANDINDEL